ncbi:MAG: hypothetical protein J5842_04515, partial [Lachnospiraceae bacterium]|nr:hypothetical protein [Lachnospiraceae bacterium]
MGTSWITDVFDFTSLWTLLKYTLASALCGIVRALYKVFEIFAGLSTVTYKNKQVQLIDVFFTNQSVTNAYWGMALIGVAMAFGFAIIAVIRKMFDIEGKNQASMGTIIGNLFRCILFIVSLTLGISIVLYFSDTLMNQISYTFNNASKLHLQAEREFTDEELSAMARCLNTIGNYSFNGSYNSRYNINACYNEIRPEMQWLQKQGVFDYNYPTEDSNGNPINNWQNALQKIAAAASLGAEAKIDVYYESLSTAMLSVMDTIHTDKNFYPLQKFKRQDYMDFSVGASVPLDRMCFLAGTMHAARNDDYNTDPSFTDPVRGKFYTDGNNYYSIYNYVAIEECFHAGDIDYLYIYLTSLFMAAELMAIIGNCISRIFNMLFLYLIAPPFFATWPLDNGGKAKQWFTAFIIQSFSVFATVLSVRVVQIFIPIVASADLKLFDLTTKWGNGGYDQSINWLRPLDYLGKLMMIIVAFMTARKASGMVTGILADNAGWQAINASDSVGNAMRGLVGKAAGGLTNKAFGAARKAMNKGAGGGAGGAGGGAGGAGGG